MSRTGPLPLVASDTWKYALLGGLASIPFTAIGYFETGSELSLSPVLFGGVLAGYLAQRNTETSRGVGFRAGLVGGLPALWLLTDVLTATSGLAGPTWFVAAGTIITLGSVLVVATLAFGLSGVIGEVGARVGSWLAGSDGRQQPPATDV